jgi:hypothetical protein
VYVLLKHKPGEQQTPDGTIGPCVFSVMTMSSASLSSLCLTNVVLPTGCVCWRNGLAVQKDWNPSKAFEPRRNDACFRIVSNK